MLKEVYEIDNNGHIKKIYLKEFDNNGNCIEDLKENIVTVQPPSGLYRAKWTGAEWIEDMSQEDIDELNNQPKVLTEEQQRLLDLELAIATILGGGM